MNPLKLFLFGTPRLEREGQPIPLRRRKVTALLAYLATTEQSHGRDAMATMLWPEYDQSGARANMRRDLSYLNKMLGENALEVSRTEIGMNPSAIWSDVAYFREQLARVESHCDQTEMLCEDCAAMLKKAIVLARGDFMAGFVLADSAQFDEWQFFQAEGLRQALGQIYPRLIDWHEAQEAYADGVENARHWVALDLLHEPAQRSLMRLYELAGQHAASLRQYKEFTQLLQDELSATPELETDKLFNLIQAKKLKRKRHAPVIEIRQEPLHRPAITQPEIVASQPKPIRHNLPPQPTPFVGREIELSELNRLLAQQSVRLITIVGPGGIGKTRLALAFAEVQLLLHREVGALTDNATSNAYFPDGIFFVALLPLHDVNQIAATIAQAVGYPIATDDQSRTPEQQLFDYLRHKHLLLILDNFEHLLAGGGLVNEILQNASGIQILVTSRERLQLQTEHIYALEGLDVAVWDTLNDAVGSTAVQLFMHSAQRVHPTFTLTSGDVKNIERICHIIGGLPLAITLAASWVDMLPLAQIADEIEQNLDFLETELRDVPARQRSMRAVFESAWQRLSSVEQELLAQLSVFRGGFDLEAVRQVTGASLRTLSSLVAKSLLQVRHSQNRYEVHELIRQFAAEKLALNQQVERETRDRHGAYFAGWLQYQEQALKGSQQLTALSELEQDLDNARNGWLWCVQQADVHSIEKGMDGLFHFYEWRGRFQEGTDVCDTALTFLPTVSLQVALTKARLLVWECRFQTAFGERSANKDLLEQSRNLLERAASYGLDIRYTKAFFLEQESLVLSDVDSRTAYQLRMESLAIFEEIGARWEQANGLRMAAEKTLALGQFEEGAVLRSQCLSIFRELGDRRGIARTLASMGMDANWKWALQESVDLLTEATEVQKSIGDKEGLARGLCSLAYTEVYMGKSTDAMHHARESLDIAMDLGDYSQQVHALVAVSDMHIYCGYYAEALSYGHTAYQIASVARDPHRIAFALHTISTAQLGCGLFTEAEESAGQGVEFSRQDGSQGWLVINLSWRAFASCGTEKPHEALQQVTEALQISSRLGYAAFGLMPLAATVSVLLSVDDIPLALELHFFLSTYPYISNWHLYQDLVEKPINDFVATYPRATVLAAQERGQKLELWSTIEKLIGELESKIALEPSMVSMPGNDKTRSAPLTRNNLPAQPTPFVGRSEELRQLDTFLGDSTIRLITIVGAGGMGKTRLALALAERQLNSGQFPHGIYFVPLAPVSEPDNIVPALAEALDFPLESSEQRRGVTQQVLDYLRQKKMLLLLDNFEHLLEGAELVSEILSEAPNVRIIATAREKLSLQEEQLYPIQGLDFPDDSLPLTEETVEQYTAIQLFVQSAHRQQPDYSVGEHELPALSQICQLVNGMPLALELTASWVNMLSLSEIAQEIEESLDFLEATLRNVPDRHRSMRAVFDTTWKRLASAERNMFAQLSVFRGGFKYHAAKEVIDISPPLLRSLVDKSLIVYSQSETRYQMHELLRQYGVEKLAREPASEHLIRDKHAAYFCNLLHAQEDALKSSQQQRALATIEADIDNIRTAWRWSVTQRHRENLIKAADSLGYFMQWQGRYQEGCQLFQFSVDGLESSGENNALVLAKLQGWLGLFTHVLDASLEISEPILLQALEHLPSHSENNQEVNAVRAFINLTLGQIYLELDLSVAESYLTESEKSYVELGHHWEEAKIAEAKGHVERLRGNFALADTYLERALRLYEQAGDQRSIVTTLEVLSTNARHAGNLDRSTQFAEQCHELAIQNGNKPDLARALTNLAFNSGPGLDNFAQGLVHQQGCVNIYEELGDTVNLPVSVSRLGFYVAACGHFDEGEKLLRDGLATLRQTTSWYHVAWTLQMLGYTMIALDRFAEAEKLLLESKSIYENFGGVDEALYGESRLIFVQRFEKSPKEIRHRLIELLCIVSEKRLYFPMVGLLNVIAVVLAEQTTIDQCLQQIHYGLPIEINECVRFNTGKKSFMMDVLGIEKPLHQLAETLPSDIVRTAKKMARERTLWQMADFMLEKLSKLGWGKV